MLFLFISLKRFEKLMFFHIKYDIIFLNLMFNDNYTLLGKQMKFVSLSRKRKHEYKVQMEYREESGVDDGVI